MTDSLQKIIARLKTVSASLSELGSILASGELVDDSATVLECAESLSALQGEPVAWMHESPERVDVIHAKVKDLLKSAGEFHRPLDKSEKYTIPLYAAPPKAAMGFTQITERH